MEILYQDKDIIVCIKPSGVLSTDEPGGLPELIRQALGDPSANLRTVHRLDQVVSGLMVLARRSKAASALSSQIRNKTFHKEYLAVCHGTLHSKNGTFEDLLLRNKEERKTYLVQQAGKDVQKAVLHYRTLSHIDDMTFVRIRLETGRTHQIRSQFSGHGFPLVGDQKYGNAGETCNIALWSYRLAFSHPYSGKSMIFTADPPGIYPWTEFRSMVSNASEN